MKTLKPMTMKEENLNNDMDIHQELENMGIDQSQVENVEYDDDAVTKVFIDIVDQEADKRNVGREQIALCLFPMKKMLSHRIRCRILSLTGAFNPVIVRVKELTPLDTLGHISQAIKLILKDEKTQFDHTQGGDSDFEKFECYVQVINGKLELNIVYDKKPVRKFDLAKEFGSLNG
jgi:hypothetical protein